MSSRSRYFVVLLLLLLGSYGRMSAQVVSATAKLTVTGLEQAPSGVWDTSTITVSFNGYLETISYAEYSTPASLASGLAAMFTRDFHQYGLWAKADANATDPDVITFQLTNGEAFGSIAYTLPATSFGLSPYGFASTGSVVADSGTVTLSVSGTPIASTHYADGATPTSIAAGLVSTASSSLVTVQSDGGLLYLISTQTGSGTDYPYSLSITHDTVDFPNPSFTISPMSGTMSGGATPGNPSTPVTVYSYSVTNSSGGSGYDAASNVKNVTDSVMGTWSYGYDKLNRLTSALSTAGPYSTSGYPNICWSYDSFGNRTHESLSNQAFINALGSPCQTATGATLQDTSAVYGGSNNRITSSKIPGQSTATSPTYDAAGNIINDGVNTTYLYDAEGRLCAVHGVYGMTGYQYNAAGTRVGKGTITTMSCDVTSNGYQPTNDYVLDERSGQMTELVISESNTATWEHTNVSADGMLVATYDTVGLHFYLNDALGSRRSQTDPAGALEQNCLSLPFGDQLNCTLSLSSPTEHHFTGKERDMESGLDYFGARYYASTMGRFTSPDDGRDQHFTDPQSWNLYLYVRDNPLNSIDPNGMQRITIATLTVTSWRAIGSFGPNDVLISPEPVVTNDKRKARFNKRTPDTLGASENDTIDPFSTYVYRAHHQDVTMSLDFDAIGSMHLVQDEQHSDLPMIFAKDDEFNPTKFGNWLGIAPSVSVKLSYQAKQLSPEQLDDVANWAFGSSLYFSGHDALKSSAFYQIGTQAAALATDKRAKEKAASDEKSATAKQSDKSTQ